MTDINKIALEFCNDRKIASIKALNAGHINDTNLVKCEDGYRFVLQRINKNVFKNRMLKIIF